MDVIVVTDETTRPQLEVLLQVACHAAKRDFPRVGDSVLVTPWDDNHAFIDGLLCDWQAAV